MTAYFCALEILLLTYLLTYLHIYTSVHNTINQRKCGFDYEIIKTRVGSMHGLDWIGLGWVGLGRVLDCPQRSWGLRVSLYLFVIE